MALRASASFPSNRLQDACRVTINVSVSRGGGRGLSPTKINEFQTFKTSIGRRSFVSNGRASIPLHAQPAEYGRSNGVSETNSPDQRPNASLCLGMAH